MKRSAALLSATIVPIPGKCFSGVLIALVLAGLAGPAAAQPVYNSLGEQRNVCKVTDGTDTADVTVAGRLQVDGSGVTQPVSGTVTANAGTGTFQVGDGAGPLSVDGTLTCNAGSGTFVVGDGSGALNVIVDSGAVAATQSGTWTVQPGNTANTTPWLFAIDQTGASNAVDVLTMPTTTVTGTLTCNAGSGTLATDPTDEDARVLGRAKIHDGTDTALVSGSGSLQVTCDNCGGASPFEDEDAFAVGTSSVGTVGYLVDETTPDSAPENSSAAPRMSPNRVPYAHLRDAAGNERGANVTAGNALVVDGSAATQPISAASLPLPTGAATAANQTTTIGHVDGVEGLLTTIDADTGTLAGAVAGNEMQVDVLTSALPTGAATSANQSTEITALQKLDNIAHAGSDVALSEHVPISGQFDDAATTTVTENQVAPARITSARALHVAQQGALSVTDGAGALNVIVDSGAVNVSDGAGALNVIVDSGALTANAGTNLNTSALALDATLTGRLPAGGSPADNESNTNTSLSRMGFFGFVFDGTAWDRMRGDSTDGVLVNLGTNNDVTVTGSVTANAGTNLNTSALALEAGGNLAGAATSLAIIDDWDETDRAKVNPIAGQAGVQGGSGVVTALTQRTVLATDVALPAGTNNIGDVDVLSFPDNEPFNLAQVAGATVATGNGTAAGSVRVSLPTDGTGVIASITTSVTPGTAAANLGKAEDVAHATGDTGVAILGVRKDTNATLTSADADYVALAADNYGVLSVSERHPNAIRCTITSTATTSTLVTGCSAPGAGLSIYVTTINWSSSIISTTANFMRLQSGTGGTCGTATIVLYDGYASVAFGSQSWTLETPWKLTANHELCFVHAAAGTRLVNITGFIAP